MSEQSALPQASPRDESDQDTVWVVAANMVDNPHPEVLGVYDTEDAANEHEQEIRENGGVWDGWPVASFWTYEKEVHTEVVKS